MAEPLKERDSNMLKLNNIEVTYLNVIRVLPTL